MSALDDYSGEMRKPPPLDDRAIESFFAGHSPSDDDGLLGSFAQSVRAFSSTPPADPRGELAAVLVDRLTIEKGDLLVTATSKVTGPRRAEVSGLPKWRKPRMTVSGLLSALITKLGALTAAAKAGLAIALTAAGVTAAGAAGALPAPMQNVVARVAGDVTPFTFPTTASPHASFGAKTSTTAVNDQGVSGSAVSSAAKGQHSSDHGAPGGLSSDAASTDTSSTGSASSDSNPTTGPPAQPGSQSSTGLNRANSTPAAGHAPTSVPTPTNPGSQSTGTGGTESTPGSQSGSASDTHAGTTSGGGGRP